MAGRATDTTPRKGKEVHLTILRLSTSRPPLPAHVKGLLETALEKARKALDSNADIATLRSVKEELEQAYGQACQCKPETQGPTVEKPAGQKKADDVMDAEYEAK